MFTRKMWLGSVGVALLAGSSVAAKLAFDLQDSTWTFAPLQTSWSLKGSSKGFGALADGEQALLVVRLLRGSATAGSWQSDRNGRPDLEGTYTRTGSSAKTLTAHLSRAAAAKLVSDVEDDLEALAEQEGVKDASINLSLARTTIKMTIQTSASSASATAKLSATYAFEGSGHAHGIAASAKAVAKLAATSEPIPLSSIQSEP
jgi:hypothetical protein